MNLADLESRWDLVVVGGGITGAGILREAVRLGLRVLLVEQNDFAWGTSSRSSKLVHGGLRYLKQGKIFLTRDSVREREYLIQDAPGLVEPLPLWIPIYRDWGPGKATLGLGLFLYSLLARQTQHAYSGKKTFLAHFPDARAEQLKGGFRYFDAQVDDARLVLRLIQDACSAGAVALNYTKAQKILRNQRGSVEGVALEDRETGQTREIACGAVINATGVWSERLHPSPNPKLHIRPLRGSHLIFEASTIPISEAVCFFHPRDNRPVFLIPWEGAVIFGTTDLDHREDLSREPGITAGEIEYLMDALRAGLPGLHVSPDQIVSTMTGVRPVLSGKAVDPSRESREHIVWAEKGLVTVTGGKLTTFRRIAWDALKATRPFLPNAARVSYKASIFSSAEEAVAMLREKLPPDVVARLTGRYGNLALELAEARREDLETVPGTQTLFAELALAARHERVAHLDDLLLRRVRIGVLTPEGGSAFLGRVREICGPLLPWDEARWQREIHDYQNLWKQCYSVPTRSEN